MHEAYARCLHELPKLWDVECALYAGATLYLGSRASHKLHLSLAIMSCHEGLIVAIASLLSMTLRRTVAVGLLLHCCTHAQDTHLDKRQCPIMG